MNSLEIQYFLTIVEHGSFTEAARALSVSQPAISKQIRLLEEELGCSLFTRSGRALSLTADGRAWHSWFQQCRFQFDLLKNRLKEQKQDGHITIRIAYPDDVDPSCFRDKIQAAAAAMKTRVRLEFSCYPEAELANRLTDGQLDLILTGKMPVTANFPAASPLPLSVHHFSQAPRILLCAASRSAATNISEFRNDTFLFSEMDSDVQSSQNLYSLFQDFGFAPKIRFAANLSTILDLTAQNEGVYLTHAWCRACKNPEYQTLVLPSAKNFYLVHNPATQKPETAELFYQLTKNA